MDDPIEEICRITDSFTRKLREPIGTPPSFTLPYQPLTYNQTPSPPFEIPSPLYSHPQYPEARCLVSPFLRVPTSIFIDREGINLSLLDFLFNLTNYTPSLLAYQVLGNFTYLALHDPSGSWIQYLQFRRPQSYGYVIGSGQETKYLDETRYSRIAEEDFQEIKNYETKGLDFVSAQGLNPQRETYQALYLLKIGGSYVLRLNTIDKGLIYILTMLFEEAWLYETPLKSRFFIGKNFRGNIGNYKQLIAELNTGKVESSRLNSIDLPPSFREWFDKIYQQWAQREKVDLEKVQKLIEGQEIELVSYHLYRLLIILSLPDTTEEPMKPDYRGSQNYVDDITLSTDPSLR